MAVIRNLTDDDIAVLVAANDSVANILRSLSLSPVSGAHKGLTARIKALGLDTSHFFSGGLRSGVKPGNYVPKELTLIKLPPGSKRVDCKRLKRCLFEVGRVDVCENCGTTPMWQGVQLTLEVHHVDGDPLNNQADNLQILCPNCHQITENYAKKLRVTSALQCA